MLPAFGLDHKFTEEAGVGPGQSVLDVAGGPGEPSLTIARIVGLIGSVMCTDAVAEMVAAAQSAAHQPGIKNIRFRQCTADSLPIRKQSELLLFFSITFYSAASRPPHKSLANVFGSWRTEKALISPRLFY